LKGAGVDVRPAFDGLFFLCPILIPMANMVKWIVLKILRPYEESIPLGKVILIELFLFFFCASIILMIKDTLLYKGLIHHNERTEMLWVYIVISVFWVLSVVPNIFLVKRKNRTYFKLIRHAA
jgi:hypothetical protein